MQETLGKRLQWKREKDWESIKFETQREVDILRWYQKNKCFLKRKLYESVGRHVQKQIHFP